MPLNAINGALSSNIWVRGRVSSIRTKGKISFIVLRDNGCTFQCCIFRDESDANSNDSMLNYVKSISLESVVDIYGKIRPVMVRSCTITDCELEVQKIHEISHAQPLPFTVSEASKTQHEIDLSQSTDNPIPSISLDTRLSSRWIDLRTPISQKIAKYSHETTRSFRQSLHNLGFIEVHTPKIVDGGSESSSSSLGSSVFSVNYFGKQLCLAQSPQLYKQMCIQSDLSRVFEIGPVFRAESSNTKRHLTEFTGLDFEMRVFVDHYEIIGVIHEFLVDLARCLPECDVKIAAKPLILNWTRVMQLLPTRQSSSTHKDDLTNTEEVVLGDICLKEFSSDVVFVVDFPSNLRPFYTMRRDDNDDISNSFDVIFRGQEICSGSQRVHDYNVLKHQLKSAGMNAENKGLQSYLESFRHGVWPHGGAGLGLERLVALLLKLDNVRKASLFPRDPARYWP